jgi:hypothetical protein
LVAAAQQTSVPFEALAALPSVREFHLRDGRVRLEGAPPALPLQKLLLSADGIARVPAAAFSTLANLTDLVLTANRIENITAAAFQGFYVYSY